jgi:hypothetical protein
MSDPLFGWGQVARGPLRVFELPNFARGSLNTPFVNFVANHLRELMDESLSVSSAPAPQVSVGSAQSTPDPRLASPARLSSVSS